MEGGRGRRAPQKKTECESLVVLFVDCCKSVARVDHFYVTQDRRVTHGSSVPLTSASFLGSIVFLQAVSSTDILIMVDWSLIICLSIYQAT